MPQLGETVTEGTITQWFKQPGDTVELDEPLFEVSTDKVDSEVPSPVAGVLREIVVAEGDTAQVGDRLAVIDDAGGAASEPPTTTGSAEATESAEPDEPVAEPAAESPPEAAPMPPPAPEPENTPVEPPRETSAAPPPPPPPTSEGAVVTSPVVRRLITDKGLDASTIVGTGEGGRITRRDVLAHADRHGAAAPPPGPTSSATPASSRAAPRQGDETVPFDNVRRRTAEHMVRSLATSAHVYTSVEVDFERVERVRGSHGSAWKDREGFSLTYLPFIVRAFCDTVDDWPRLNASVEGESLVIHHDVNLSIAVDMDHRGLVAPVVRAADGKRIRLLAREIRDLAQKARSGGLGPDDLVGGTFTITNPGPFGSHMTLPIINQPQVAILSTDGIKKRPVVVEGPDGEDTIAVHATGMLVLTWDHRAFDGAYASAFLAQMKEILEGRDWEAELE
ncbi:MAG: dihydrolipoamide acetyltransferase family protein [Acidimicrobiia bacterium]